MIASLWPFSEASNRNEDRAYKYDGHGMYYGGHNVSPEGASVSVHKPATNWIRSVTGSYGDAGVLLKAYRDPIFLDIALYGNLRDQIAILSKTLAVLIARDGSQKDRIELGFRFEEMLNHPKRLELFAKAYPLHRMNAIQIFFKTLNLANRQATLDLIRFLPVGGLRAYEMPLMERTFLLISLHRYTTTKDLERSFIPDFISFYETFLWNKADAREVNVRLAPDVALLFAEIINNVCRKRIMTDKVYFARFLRDIHSLDLIKAIAYELDAISGETMRNCMENMVGRKISYNRRRDFPMWPLPRKVHLRHPPRRLNGWEIDADNYGVVIEPSPAKKAQNQKYRNLKLAMKLRQDGQSISVTASGRFLVLHLSYPRRVGSPFDSSAAEDFNDTGTTSDYTSDSSDSSDTMDTFDFPLSNPFASTTSDSDSFNSFNKANRWAKLVVDVQVINDKVKERTFRVLRGDIVLAMFKPDTNDDYPNSKESDSMVYAWHGTKREILLQIDATMASKDFYYLVLVE